MERRHGDKPQCSDDVLLELVKLVRDTIHSRCEVADSIDRLSRKVDQLIAAQKPDAAGQAKIDAQVGRLSGIASKAEEIQGQPE